MITLSTNSVGKDAFFREIHAGDTVQDMDGTKYTVDEHGGCKPLSGSGYTHLSKLKEPALVNGPAVPMPDGRMHTGPIDTSVPSKAQPSLGDLMSSRKNKSGFVALENMVRGSQITGTQLRRLLESQGVEIVKRKSKAMIRIEDRLRASDLLRQAEKDPSIIPSGKTRKPPVPKAPKVPVEVKPGEPAPLTEDPDPVFPGSYDDLLPGFTPETCTVRDAGDKMLADELRRRGYTVTATKHIEL